MRSQARAAFLILAISGMPLAEAGEPKLNPILPTGHGGIVSAIALSTDGKRLVTGGDDGTAYLWDADSGRRLQTFNGRGFRVRSLAFSDDGKRVLIGTEDLVANLWDVDSGSAISHFSYSMWYVRPTDSTARFFGFLALSGDGKLVIAATDRRNEVDVWRAGDAMPSQTLGGHDGEILSAGISANGAFAVTGSIDKKAILWDTASGQPIRTFQGPERAVEFVALSADGGRTLAHFKDSALIVWNTASGVRIYSNEDNLQDIHNVAFSRDGRYVVFAAGGGRVVKLEVDTGKRAVFQNDREPRQTRVAVSAQGERIAAIDRAGDVVFWEGQRTWKISTQAPPLDLPIGATMDMKAEHILAELANTRWLLWDTLSTRGPREVASSQAESVVLSQDGQKILLVQGGQAHLRTSSKDETLLTIRDHNVIWQAAALSGDGKKIFLVGAQGAGSYFHAVWDAESGTAIRHVWGGFEYAGMKLDGEGKRVTSQFFEAVQVWDTRNGEEIQALRGSDTVRGLLLSDDCQWALAGNGPSKRAILWDVDSGKILRTFEGHDGAVSCVALSKDKSLVISGSGDRTAIIWDAVTGKKLQTLAGHTGDVHSVGLTSDNLFALTASRNAGMRLWDARTGKELAKLVSMNGGQDWLVTTPEGYFDGSIDAQKLLTFQIAGTHDFVPMEQGHDRYYRPGLLGRVLKGENVAAK